MQSGFVSVLTIYIFYIEVENLYMNSFRTRGRFGFNHAQARFEMPTVESTTPKRRKLDEPKSETVEYVGHSDSGRCVAKYVHLFICCLFFLSNRSSLVFFNLK